MTNQRSLLNQFRLSIAVLCVFFIFNVHASKANALESTQCSANFVIADYQILRNKNSLSTTLQLVRTENKVAHFYPATQVTETWELNHAGGIKPTRYFDKHKRAIEYQPNEQVHGKVEKDWLYRYQLLSEQYLANAQLVDESGEQCNLKQTFTKQTQGTLSSQAKTVSHRIVYFPYLKLIERFEIAVDGETIEEWTLENVQHDKAQISGFFEKLSAYKATDFADIGDDHTDPFLTQMVSVGFIEAGASGFYQADKSGNVTSIGTGHNHSH